MESSPSGPLICTVDMAFVRAPLPFTEGALTLKVTPGGIDSGAEPILDWHGAVEANPRAVAGCWKAGTRNSGIDSVVCGEAASKLRAQRRRAVENMVV
jgi:hypothetical protein